MKYRLETEKLIETCGQAGPGHGDQWNKVLLEAKQYPEPVPGPVLFITFVKELGHGAVQPQHVC